MPRPRRKSRDRRQDVTEGERLWALGQLRKDHPEYVTVKYFSTINRLSEVWRVVHGEKPWPGTWPASWYAGYAKGGDEDNAA